MKSYNNLKKSMIVGLIIFFFLLSNNLVSSDEGYNISFASEPTVELDYELISNGEVKGRAYFINISLENSGSANSEELLVNLTDQEGFTLTNLTTIAAGETKTISFKWSTVFLGEQTLFISYYPSNLNKAWNTHNHDQTTVSLIQNENSKSSSNTPGFELMLFIIAIALIFKKRKIK